MSSDAADASAQSNDIVSASSKGCTGAAQDGTGRSQGNDRIAYKGCTGAAQNTSQAFAAARADNARRENIDARTVPAAERVEPVTVFIEQRGTEIGSSSGTTVSSSRSDEMWWRSVEDLEQEKEVPQRSFNRFEKNQRQLAHKHIWEAVRHKRARVRRSDARTRDLRGGGADANRQGATSSPARELPYGRLVEVAASWPADNEAFLADSLCAVEGNVKVMHFDHADAVPASLEELRDAECEEVRTKGDGACAVHAVFGQSVPDHVALEHRRPRQFLKDLFDKPLEEIRSSVRPSQQHLVDAVVSSLWSDFVVPFLGYDAGEPPTEEAMFLRRLKASSVWDVALRHAHENEMRNQSRDNLVGSCMRDSAGVFARSSTITFGNP